MKKGNISVRPLRRIDLARATGCNLETIRYYEKLGIMPDPPRDANGYRRYDDAHVSRLNFVMRGRELGFKLEEIQSLLTLVDGGVQTCVEVEKLARRQVENVRSKIADLVRIEVVLSQTLAKCTGEEVPECAVIDALSHGSEKGTSVE